VATPEVTFSVPEVKRNLVAAAGALFRLPAAMPKNVAMEMLLTGDPIDAERAYEVGFVNRLAEPGQAIDVAIELAAQISENAPLAVRKSRQVALETFDSDEEAFAASGRAIAEVMASEDTKEGLERLHREAQAQLAGKWEFGQRPARPASGAPASSRQRNDGRRARRGASRSERRCRALT
jgi:enoyl-CoA hydratase